MKHYVLGFVFNRDKTKVLLIHKKRPKWAAGKWNGIGGKIGDKLGSLSENPLEAMSRECIEEIGYKYAWKHCITFVCGGGTVFVYKAVSDYNSMGGEGVICYHQEEDETLMTWRLDSLPDNRIDDSKWIIPMLLSTCQFPIILHEDNING